MTDKQIIAALRCSSSVVDNPHCDACPYQIQEEWQGEIITSCDVDRIGQDAADRLEELTGDVAPVRHGRWDGDFCTACKLPWNYHMTQNAQDCGYWDPMPDYCPNCGAKMDDTDT